MNGFDESDHKRLEALGKKIDAAQSDMTHKPQNELPFSGERAMSAGRTGFELMGIVLAGVGLGWLADGQFGLSPWGTLTGLFAGFIAAVFHAWRAMKDVAEDGR